MPRLIQNPIEFEYLPPHIVVRTPSHVQSHSSSRTPSPPVQLIQPCGITYEEPTGPVYLPLEQLQVHIEIVDVSATVTLTQTFWQCTQTTTPSTKYVFPVPAQAAVCGFEMRTEDGRVITAVAKEKEVARKEYEQAIERGRMTGLVEHVTDDVFTIALGCLPQLQMITTKLTYVMDLVEDDFTDQVRFQLPVSVGMRYGTLPDGMVDAKTIPPHRIKIAANVYMRGAIQSITSPSHATLTFLDEETLTSAPRVHRRAGEYLSPSFLSQDFILSIKAEGLDAARCFGEKSPAGTVAMQLTAVPKFKLPPIPAQEYVFLVDRSGSMCGPRIETAKRALVMLMHALPSKGTMFNILSFGSTHTSLWDKSMSYNGETVTQATQHVDSMSANYGGTEIDAALEYMFKTRCIDLPTACFVLTDGEAYKIIETIASVTNAVAQAKPDAPLRVFTLGIGETTSSVMCNGIARAGNGVCLMTATSDSIIAKCSKLVKASRTEILEDVTVDWGVPAQPLDALQASNPQSVVFRQGPRDLPRLYAGIRFVVFAIIENEEFVVPKEVVIQAKRIQTGEVVRFAVAVEELTHSEADPQKPLIHTLAARRIIMDLVDGQKGNISPLVKQTIIHLGEHYQLASQFTSFIAVEGENQEKLDPSPLLDDWPRDENDYPARGRSPVDLGRPPRYMSYSSSPAVPVVPMAVRYAPQAIHIRPTGPSTTQVREVDGSPHRVAVVIPSRSASPCYRRVLPSIHGEYSPSSTPSAIYDVQTPSQGTRAVPIPVASVLQAIRIQPMEPSAIRVRKSHPPVDIPSTPPSPRCLSNSPPGRSDPPPGRSPPYSPSTPPSPSCLSGEPLMCVDSSRSSTRSPTRAIQARSRSPSLRRAHHIVRSPTSSYTRWEASRYVEPAEQLVRLQSFDGSFAVTEELVAILGRDAIDEAGKRQVDAMVWATILAVAYLQKHLIHQPELLEALLEKAMEFVEQAHGGDVSALLDVANHLVQ